MKSIFILLFLLITVNLYSQPEFKISIENFIWEKPSSNQVYLTIYLKIQNIGNEKGWCEDLQGLYLDCSNSNYYFGSQITMSDYSNNIKNIIKPGGNVEAFVSFRTPRDADDLTLRFTEFYGGASKYITESYDKYYSKFNNEKFESELNEADNYFYNKDYDNAILKYHSANGLAYVDNGLKEGIFEKLAVCYEIKGDINVEKSNYLPAIEDYINSLKCIETKQVNEKIGKVYKILGDDMYSKGVDAEALNYYKSSLAYSDIPELRTRKNELEQKIKKKEEEEIYNKQQKILYDSIARPTFGLRLNPSLALAHFSGNNVSGTVKPFWGIAFSVTPKLYVETSTHFFSTLNFELGVSGMFGSFTDMSSFTEFYNFDTLKNELPFTPPSTTVISVNGGIGIGLLNYKVSPMLFVSYCYNSMNEVVSFYKKGTYDQIDIDETYSSGGFKIALDFLFGRAIVIGYSFKQFQFSDKYNIFGGTYTFHSINLGYMYF
ncbi:MAG: DUF4352 domain-containing protein [Ignavibacteriae bacterium]|nr:MAG: DUF4352 domain-containing protein [Ignavibacteriota bacterium]